MKKLSKDKLEAIKVWNSKVRDGGFGVSVSFFKWAADKVVPKRAYASGHKAWCSRCGHSFKTDKTSGRVVCPDCGSRLEVFKSRCWHNSDVLYAQEVTVWGEFQVVRTYIVDAWYRKGVGQSVYVWHAYDWLINEKGRKYCFSRKITMFPGYRRIPFSLWDLPNVKPMGYKRNGHLSQWTSGWAIEGCYPKRRYQPWLEKYDVRGKFMGFDMYNVIDALMNGTPHFETVWKMNNRVLCRAVLYYASTGRLWPQIKIALRHGFKFKDWKMWVDHIDMLKEEGYDIFNPKYIAPEDLNKAHNILVREHQARIEREERERERQRKIAEIERSKALKDPNSPLNVEYRSRIGKALAVVVKSGNIVIKPLQDIRDFYEEGKALHHCVYTNKYYEESGSLILGAKVSGKRTETIELNLKTFQIEQCRGKYNQDSKYHQDIYSLMKKAIFRYKKAYSAQQAG